MPHASQERRPAARRIAALLLFTTVPAQAGLQLWPPGDAPPDTDFAADPLPTAEDSK